MQQALGSAIVRFHRLYWSRITALVASAFEEELTKSQFMVLGIVASQEEATMTALADHTGMLKQQITRIVDRLEEKGLVVRERCSQDRRSVRVRVTAQAARYLEDVEKRSVAVIMDSLRVLTDDERAQLTDHFSALNALLKNVPVPAEQPKEKATGR